MKMAENLVEMLEAVGKKAVWAVEVTGKAMKPFAEAIIASGLEDEEMVGMEVRGKTVVSSANPKILKQLCSLAQSCDIAGVSVVPRVTPQIILDSHGQGKLTWVENRAGKGDLLIVRQGDGSVTAEGVQDVGYRNLTRTLAVQCQMVDGQATPVLYTLTQYEWNGKSFVVQKTESYTSQWDVAEAIRLGFKTIDDIVATIEDEAKKAEETDRMNEQVRFKTRVVYFLAGLAMSVTYKLLSEPRNPRYEPGPLGRKTFADLLAK